jgi:ubiquinone/menaquinone biosynthesis C-methylase UbiE
MTCSSVKDFQTSSSDTDKNLHYCSVKKYFKEEIFTKNKKIIFKKRKIFNLCISILEDFLKQNSKLVNLLDVGSGTGDFTLNLGKKFPQFKQIVGVDFLKEIVDKAQDKVTLNKKILFIQADLLNIPFYNKTFDITICIDVLHHIHRDDLKCALGELMRVTNNFLILEIRNKKNIFDFWYNNVVKPFFYRNLPIHTTSLDEVNHIAGELNFHLDLARRIDSSRFNCRRLILVYERID